VGFVFGLKGQGQGLMLALADGVALSCFTLMDVVWISHGCLLKATQE